MDTFKLYKEHSSKDGYFSYWHIDITKALQELWGEDIVANATIISPPSEFISQKDIEEYHKSIQSHWEKSHKIYLPYRDCTLSIHFKNGKKAIFNLDTDMKKSFIG